MLILTVLMTGCIKDNCYKCDYNIPLLLSYVDVDGNNLFHEELDSLSVHIFNENDKYVQAIVEKISTIAANGYVMTIPIEEKGTYKFVVIGDTDQTDYTTGSQAKSKTLTKTLVPFETHIDDFRISVKHTDGLINRELGDFFIAKQKEILITGIENNKTELMLTKNIKKIHLTINGLGDSPNLTPIIRCKNGTYNSENNIPDNSEEITYKPYTPRDKTRANNVFTLNTLRIIEGVAMPLSLKNEQGETKVRDLISLIKLNPKYKTQKEIDAEDEFNLTLNYDTDGSTLISVMINNWEYVWVTPIGTLQNN